jgi:hypothetical protein
MWSCPLAAQPHNISASYSCEFVLLAPDDCSELPSDSYFKLHADRFSDPLRSHIWVRDMHSLDLQLASLHAATRICERVIPFRLPSTSQKSCR